MTKIASSKDITLLYRLISECINKDLSTENDQIFIERAKDRSHNAIEGKMLECTINGVHRIGIKRCLDKPEYLRREVVIDQAKKTLGLPSYTIIRRQGLKLFLGDIADPEPLPDWDDKDVLYIDFGSVGDREPLDTLDPDRIEFADFSHQFGQWTAFNYLFEVLDRFGRNYLYSISSKMIHSIDNELCRYSNNKILGYSKVFNPPKHAFQRYLTHHQPVDSSYLVKGFIDGWKRVANNLNRLEMFSNDERKRITQRVSRSKPEQLVNRFFQLSERVEKRV